MELLTHAQAVDTRSSSLIFLTAGEWGYHCMYTLPVPYFIWKYNSFSQGFPANFHIALLYNIIFVVFPSVQDPVTVSADCPNGQVIRASSYEVVYASSSGTSNIMNTCLVDGTDCIDGVCHHELQNNTADSRCQPPELQFNNESVTATVTAINIVGRSNPASKLFMAFLCSRMKFICEEIFNLCWNLD